MLLHFDPKRKIQLETDASGVAISAILSQLVESTGQWHPIAFWSRKMHAAQLNYGVGETEMLAIVEACKELRHYLEGAIHSIRVLTDHCNLRTFLTTKNLSRREARWWERLSSLDLVMEYRPGRHNPADGPSRRPDFMEERHDLSHQAGAIIPGRFGGVSEGNRGGIQELITSNWTTALVNCESQVADDAIDWESTINELSDGANRDLIIPPVVDKNCRSTAQAQQTTEGIGIDSAEIVEIPEILAVVGRTKGKKSGSSSDTSQLHEKLINLKSVGLKLVETSDEKFGISREEIKNVSEKDSAFGAEKTRDSPPPTVPPAKIIPN